MMEKMNEKTIKTLYFILASWWDFMDRDNAANRNEYTIEEQRNMFDKFIKEITRELL